MNCLCRVDHNDFFVLVEKALDDNGHDDDLVIY